LTGSFLAASLAVLVGGITEGSFLFPMRLIKRWAWENVWFVYSFAGLLVIPWTVAIWTIPHLTDVYASIPAETLLLTALFGFGWGVANVLFGSAVPLVGMALSFAIVVGMSASLGCLVPIIVSNPARLGEPSGMMVIGGVGLTCVGIALLGIAGRARERTQRSQNPASASGSLSNIKLGLMLCLMSGLLAPMLNYSFIFGSPISAEAIAHGATRGQAANATWAIALLGGLLGNGGYAVIKLIRNRTWSHFGRGEKLRPYFLSASMGLLFTAGLFLYGWGATGLGDLGPAVGWPIFQSVMIILSSGIGIAMGEWRGTAPRIVRMNLAGLMVLLSAILLLSFGNRA
jgi:L-rhamnose-H+ transport protein